MRGIKNAPIDLLHCTLVVLKDTQKSQALPRKYNAKTNEPLQI